MEDKNFIDKSPLLYKVYHESFLAKPLHKVKQFSIYLKYKGMAMIQYIQSLPRALGYKDKRFFPLLSYKNKYKGGISDYGKKV